MRDEAEAQAKEAQASERARELRWSRRRGDGAERELPRDGQVCLPAYELAEGRARDQRSESSKMMATEMRS